jgi:hypothetical protein
MMMMMMMMVMLSRVLFSCFVNPLQRIELVQSYTLQMVGTAVSLPSVLVLTFNEAREIIRHEVRYKSTHYFFPELACHAHIDVIRRRVDAHEITL